MNRPFLTMITLIATISAGCADDTMPEEPEPAVPIDPEPPTATTPEPFEEIDGEYAVRIDSLSYVCAGVSYEEPVYRAIASIVEQDFAGWFDLLARGAGGFTDFTHGDVEGNAGGFFEDEYSFEWEITPGYPPAVFIVNAAGTAAASSVDFVNAWTAGWFDQNGDFHTECDIAYRVRGDRRYPNWPGTPRAGHDGQWRIWHETLEDSFGDPEEPRYRIIDTIAQRDDGSSFDLKWARFSLKDVPRAPDGGVVFAAWYGSSFVQLFGLVENEHLDLELTWDWYDSVTGALIRHVKDRYTGVPRFEPHAPGAPEPPTGAFNAELVQTADTCDGLLDVRRYVIEALPAEDGEILLWIAGLKPPPFAPNPDGTFSFSFDRDDNWHFKYQLDGSIDGDAISFTMRAEALWPDTNAPYCDSDYVASGVKRYRNLFPPEP